MPQGSVLGPVLFVLYTQPLSQILFNHSCPHQFFADDTQLCKSCSPEHYDDTRNAFQTCISDIKDRATENKVQLKADKTEKILFNSSKLKHTPAPLSICLATISFSNSARNLGFYLAKDPCMKKHISSSSKLLFWKSDIIVLFATTSLMMPPKLVGSLVLSRIDYCNFLLAGLPQSLVGKLPSPTQCSPSCSPCTSTCSHHSNTQTSSLVACHSTSFYKTTCLCFNAITSSTPAYLSDLLHLYSPSRSLRSSADTHLLKIPLYKFKTKGDHAFSYYGPSV